jgi:hypothetical protein
MKEVLDYKMPSFLIHIKSTCAARILFFAGILCLPVILNAQVDCVSGISITPASQVVCLNSIPTTITASLTITSNGSPGNITYKWYSNPTNNNSGGTLVKTTTTTTTATTSDTYIPLTTTSGTTYYYCIITNDASCSTPAYTTNTSEVIVQTPPTINLSSSPSGAICEGTNVIFTATNSSGSYQWKVNGTNVGSNTNTYSSATLAHGDIVSVVFTSSTSCNTPITKQVSMLVNDAVVPQVTIDASSDLICSGTPVTFTASPINGGASPVYQWKVNGLNVGAGGNTFITSTLSDGDLVSVGMISNAVCAVPASVTSNSIPVTVNPNIPVSVNISASNNNICSGSSVTFTATPVNGGSSPIYQWKVNGVDAGSNSPTFTTSGLANNDVVTVQLSSNITPCATNNPGLPVMLLTWW